MPTSTAAGSRRRLQEVLTARPLEPGSIVVELGAETRAQFFAFASHSMRRILVDHASGRNRSKRGSGAQMIPLADIGDQPEPMDVDLVALDEALDALTQLDEQLARIVELRFFAGLSTREIAVILETSAPTVSRQWTIAKGWLFKELKS